MEGKKPLFTDLTPEESASVSGGNISFNLNMYMFMLGAGVLFGNPGLTPDEIQFAWEQSFVFNRRRSRRRRRRRNWLSSW
ncbi:MAG: hypothetical protein QNJ47_17695 [Nostocaceae cyanobacterium]|nr:hypothetical protein [Nostocaceae cyanobacterium]